MMNKEVFGVIIGTMLLPLILTGCRSEPPPTAIVPSPSAAPSDTPVPTKTPSPNPTAIPALTLGEIEGPVLVGTPVPMPNEPITPENVDRLQELAVWGKGQVKQIAHSADGKFLVVGSTSGIWLYDAKTLEMIRFRQTIDEVTNLIFLPDNETVMAQVGSNTIIRWNATTGELLGSWNVGVGVLRNTALAPDGMILASALEDGQVGLWDIESGRLLETLEGRLEAKKLVTGLAFSPDGALLASTATGNTIRLWEVKTTNLLYTLPGHSNSASTVFKLLFSPDGAILASASSDVRLWQVETGTLLHTLVRHDSGP
ncbi:MAG: hypothetical protein JXM69_19330 [Anaerolineae bacterium]|nr:hypothetical protein [Anaerolineae bacterium]